VALATTLDPGFAGMTSGETQRAPGSEDPGARSALCALRSMLCALRSTLCAYFTRTADTRIVLGSAAPLAPATVTRACPLAGTATRK